MRRRPVGRQAAAVAVVVVVVVVVCPDASYVVVTVVTVPEAEAAHGEWRASSADGGARRARISSRVRQWRVMGRGSGADDCAVLHST